MHPSKMDSVGHDFCLSQDLSLSHFWLQPLSQQPSYMGIFVNISFLEVSRHDLQSYNHFNFIITFFFL